MTAMSAALSRIAALRTSKANLGVDAVLVLLAQSLFGGAAARRIVIIQNSWIENFRRASAVEAGAAIDQLAALQQQGIAPVGELDPPRRAVAILPHNSMGPLLGRRFEVTVCGNVAIVSSHE